MYHIFHKYEYFPLLSFKEICYVMSLLLTFILQCFILFYFFSLVTGFHYMSIAGLKLRMYTGLTSNLQRSVFLCLLSAEVKGIHSSFFLFLNILHLLTSSTLTSICNNFHFGWLIIPVFEEWRQEHQNLRSCSVTY